MGSEIQLSVETGIYRLYTLRRSNAVCTTVDTVCGSFSTSPLSLLAVHQCAFYQIIETSVQYFSEARSRCYKIVFSLLWSQYFGFLSPLNACSLAAAELGPE